MTKRGGSGKLGKTCIERVCLTLKAQPLPHRTGGRVVGSASGTYKVIDPDGAKVYKFWEDSSTGLSSSRNSAGSVEVAHLPQGTSVEVTATRGNQARIVAPNVGCVSLASLEQIASAPVASEASAPAPAPTHRYQTRRSGTPVDEEPPVPDLPDDRDELREMCVQAGVPYSSKDSVEHIKNRLRKVAPAAAPTPVAPTPAPAPAAPPPEDDDAVMAEATETQDQANARRRDEITANLDQLAINRPDTYTTLVGSLVRLTRDLVGLENPTTSVPL